jgi:hypothetical protein
MSAPGEDAFAIPEPSTLRPAASEKRHTIPSETDQAGCRRWVKSCPDAPETRLLLLPEQRT